LFNDLLPEYSNTFIEKKLSESKNRVKRYGGSVYLLEPNIKECEGGAQGYPDGFMGCPGKIQN